MSESTLTLGLLDLRNYVAEYLGWSVSDATALTKIDNAIQSGLRLFYVPPLTPGERTPHDWSFLHPVTTLDTTAADEDQDLPDDFGHIEGTFTYEPEVSTHQIRVVGEGRLRQMREALDQDGDIEYAAIRWKSNDGTTGQRQEVMWYPTPDDTYTLTYRYYALPFKLTTSLQYPLGGEPHSQTILAACLAAAEERFNGGRGSKWEGFLERVQASIAVDRRNNPVVLGYNRDRSDVPDDTDSAITYVTYNGTLYEE